MAHRALMLFDLSTQGRKRSARKRPGAMVTRRKRYIYF
jgi:hypothetical protein